MHPPFSLTGDTGVDWIIAGAGFLFALYWFRALRLARQGTRRFLSNLALGGALFLVVIALLPNAPWKRESGLLICGGVCTGLLLNSGSKCRSRHIPAAVKRRVIARDLKGEAYDPKRHHIDHVWPFAKWGSHTEDNLRVIEKRKNLQKVQSGRACARCGESFPTRPVSVSSEPNPAF